MNTFFEESVGAVETVRIHTAELVYDLDYPDEIELNIIESLEEDDSKELLSSPRFLRLTAASGCLATGSMNVCATSATFHQ